MSDLDPLQNFQRKFEPIKILQIRKTRYSLLTNVLVHKNLSGFSSSLHYGCVLFFVSHRTSYLPDKYLM